MFQRCVEPLLRTVDLRVVLFLTSREFDQSDNTATTALPARLGPMRLTILPLPFLLLAPALAITFDDASAVVCNPVDPDQYRGKPGYQLEDCQRICLCDGGKSGSNKIKYSELTDDGKMTEKGLPTQTDNCKDKNAGNCKCK